MVDKLLYIRNIRWVIVELMQNDRTKFQLIALEKNQIYDRG